MQKAKLRSSDQRDMLPLLMSRFVVTNIAGNEYGLTISNSIRYYIIDCSS
jgi:hypothetical protein